MKKCLLFFLTSLFTINLFAQTTGDFNGLNTHMGNLSRLSKAKSRSISPENFTGEKGKGGMTKLEDGSAKFAARELGQGWKVNPYVVIQPGETVVMCDIEGMGAVQHIWMTPTGDYRLGIFRCYWDGEDNASVEVPVGDFFASGWGWGNEPEISSLAICVNPHNGFNSYWQMPFRNQCKMTMENRSNKEMILYYQIDYTLTEVPEDAAYFHAQFRKVDNLKAKTDYVILDNVKGQGQYVGLYLAHGANSPGWWGEGEIKFFMDGDTQYPTICGTGEEDYFCGSYGYEMKTDDKGNDIYTDFSTLYTGFHHIKDPYNARKQARFGQYRWHVTDPIRFESDLRITLQALGWKKNGAYLPLKDDYASVAYWYQTEPHNPFPPLPSNDQLVIINADSIFHSGKNKRVSLLTQPSSKYNNIAQSLTDGLKASANYNDYSWMGYEGNDMEVVIDLEDEKSIESIEASFLSDQNAWIFLPAEVEILSSRDGKIYTSNGTMKFSTEKRELEIKELKFNLNKKARYIKIKAKNIEKCPEWHTGAGQKAWIFVDEIVIN